MEILEEYQTNCQTNEESAVVSKVKEDLESTMFEAEVEFVLDELQDRTRKYLAFRDPVTINEFISGVNESLKKTQTPSSKTASNEDTVTYELADIIFKVLEFSAMHDLNLSDRILAKLEELKR